MRYIGVMLAASVMLLTSCTAKSYEKSGRDYRRASPMPQTSYNAQHIIPKERDGGFVKAMWISYIDLAPMLADGTEESFRSSFSKACGNISDLGCNTVFVHVRAFGDALYDSQFFPPSQMAGEFDALDMMCEIAHEHGLKLHAWINPLRLQTADVLSDLGGYKTSQWYLQDTGQVSAAPYDDHLWLDPAFPEVRELIADGAAEIVVNYPVDGIHYDDYFYPTTDEAFDAQCYEEMSQGESLDDWRRSNIDELCRAIYSAVKAADSDVCVSISPQGNIENNHDIMYADVEKWCSEVGYCDIIIPQIYFGYDNSTKPFTETLREWEDICSGDDVRLVIGLGAYKIGVEDEFTENEGIIAQQIEDCADHGGVALYSYSSFFGGNVDTARVETEKQMVASALQKIGDEC